MVDPLDNYKSIPEAFYAIAHACPDLEVYRQAVVHEGVENPDILRPSYGRTFREVRERVNGIAAYLLEIGIRPGDRVAIISNTRPEWLEADIAILGVGGVVVAVYPSLTSQDIGYLLFDSGAEVVFAENEEQKKKLLELLNTPCKIPGAEERPATEVRLTLKRVVTFEATESHALVTRLRDILTPGKPDPTGSFGDLKRDDLATLVYTSGTTGPPKGVIQTHGNHLANVRQARTAEMYQETSSIMLFLPLAHSFAKLMGYIGFLTAAKLVFPSVASKKSSKFNQESITRDIREAGAEIVPLVPRILEKMQGGIISRAERSDITGKILRYAIDHAKIMYQAKKVGAQIGLKDNIISFLLSPIRKKIAVRLFGQGFKTAIVGGAKLSPDVNTFFDSLGIEVIEGYGLTETCVATNVNRHGKKKIGTVGPVLSPDIEMRITDEGEICYRGPNITRGYYNRSKATAEAWDRDGWFHTGDLGSVDKDGYLTITGRKKELIVTAGGKKISPENIEERIKTSPYISQVVLCGEGKPFCVALVVLDAETVREWAAKNAHQIQEPFEKDQKIRSLIEAEFAKVNGGLASFESIKRFAILDDEFSIDNGLLTPTLKVKRREVVKRFSREIEELYKPG